MGCKRLVRSINGLTVDKGVGTLYSVNFIIDGSSKAIRRGDKPAISVNVEARVQASHANCSIETNTVGYFIIILIV